VKLCFPTSGGVLRILIVGSGPGREVRLFDGLTEDTVVDALEINEGAEAGWERKKEAQSKESTNRDPTKAKYGKIVVGDHADISKLEEKTPKELGLGDVKYDVIWNNWTTDYVDEIG